MPSFDWQDVTSDNFGPGKAPIAHVRFTSTANVSRDLSIVIDSGAVVTFLKRSVGELLRIDVESGRRIELSAVGGARNTAFVHQLRLGFPPNGEPGISVPVAISASENVPNLLGRLGVFDQFQIWHDPTLQETTLFDSCGTKNDAEVHRQILKHSIDIIRRFSSSDNDAAVKDAVATLINRCSQLAAAAVQLVQLHCTGGLAVELRALFEMSLQLEFLMQDPVPRARRYREFRAVSKWRQLQAWTAEGGGSLSRRIAAGGSGADYDRLLRESEAVASSYVRANGRRSDNWFCMSIRDLAKRVNRVEEYDRWYTSWCAWIHGDPFGLPLAGRSEALLLTQQLYARCLLAVGTKMVLTSEQVEELTTLAKPHI